MHRPVTRREIWLVVLLAAGTASTFLPWGVSGSTGRNSYELVDAARTLDLLDGILLDGAVAWFVAPILAAASVLSVVFHRARIAALLSVLFGALLIGGWWMVKSSAVRVDTGATAGALLGVAIIAASLVLLQHQGPRREPRQPARQSEPEPASVS